MQGTELAAKLIAFLLSWQNTLIGMKKQKVGRYGSRFTFTSLYWIFAKTSLSFSLSSFLLDSVSNFPLHIVLEELQ